MIIGNIGGYDVEYDELMDVITCKDVIVRAQQLIDGYESSLDRYSLEKGLVLRKNETHYTMGCLKIENNIGKNLIKTIKHVRHSKQTEERLRQYAEA